VAISAALSSASAVAGPALDDDPAKRSAPPSAQASHDELDCVKVANDPRCQAVEIDYGVGLRARAVWLPKAVLDLFLDRAAGGAMNYGGGIDFTRRRGTTELQIGFEYEHVNVGEGVWINKGDNVATGAEADYVLSPHDSGHQLGWFTAEFTFINHAEINHWLSFRYGAGLGIGVITGELDHYNIICTDATNANPTPGCVPPRFNGRGTYSEGAETQVAYNLPPVFPVINAIVGFQFKPTDKMTINIEGGLRTLPFAGISSSYFF
jgi:hypothetical protein